MRELHQSALVQGAQAVSRAASKHWILRTCRVLLCPGNSNGAASRRSRVEPSWAPTGAPASSVKGDMMVACSVLASLVPGTAALPSAPTNTGGSCSGELAAVLGVVLGVREGVCVGVLVAVGVLVVVIVAMGVPGGRVGDQLGE